MDDLSMLSTSARDILERIFEPLRENPSLSIEGICKKQGINPADYYKARKQLSKVNPEHPMLFLKRSKSWIDNMRNAQRPNSVVKAEPVMQTLVVPEKKQEKAVVIVTTVSGLSDVLKGLL